VVKINPLRLAFRARERTAEWLGPEWRNSPSDSRLERGRGQGDGCGTDGCNSHSTSTSTCMLMLVTVTQSR
jgi:hypothetical protein